MKNPLLLTDALARAHDALDLHAMQVVVAPSAWAEIVRDLKKENGEAIKLINRLYEALDDECVGGACRTPGQTYVTPSVTVLNDAQKFLESRAEIVRELVKELERK